jgi:transposase
MTIPGVDFAVAVGIIAAVGDVSRFRSAQKLVNHFGLNPRVRQSGLQPAQHGRITKQGRAHARGMLAKARSAGQPTWRHVHSARVRVGRELRAPMH